MNEVFKNRTRRKKKLKEVKWEKSDIALVVENGELPKSGEHYTTKI